MRCLNTLNCLAPGRTGKTVSRETEQNVNAAVLWTPYQRGLPEQGGLGGRQVTGKSSSARNGYQRRERRGVVLRQEGKQSLALLVDEGAGRVRQCQRHAAQYHVVLQRSAERARFECANEYGPLRGGGSEMKCWDTLTVTPPGGQGRRHAEGRDETPALPYSGHCTSEVCLNMAATEGARRRERCRHCVVRVPERRGKG